MTNVEKEEIKKIINDSLNKAEEHWENGGYLLQENITMEDASMDSIAKRESEPSKIPGYSVVQDNETKIDDFIALVMDMRDSSKHLMENIASAKVTELERIYYETSALLPAVAKTINFQEGGVTEYLGDGILAFFKIDESDKDESIRKAFRASKNIIDGTREIINTIIQERYSLPPINIGVGLASSKALITLVGLPKEKHPKAFGKCVFRATKLSGGNNAIYIDDVLKDMWPTSSGGRLKFKSKNVKGVDGYLIERGSL